MRQLNLIGTGESQFEEEEKKTHFISLSRGRRHKFHDEK